MPIVQDAYYIPDDIATGLITGIYARYGSIIRYATGPNRGQIVKHLVPVNVKAAEQAKSLGAKAIDFVVENRKAVGLAAVSVTIVGVGVWAYTEWKKHEPKALTEFRSALRGYIDAVRGGNVDIEKIDALLFALDALKAHKRFEKISIQLTAEELDVLVSRICEYTIKLAADNDVELTADELAMDDSTIINLQSYLNAQKRIFESAA